MTRIKVVEGTPKENIQNPLLHALETVKLANDLGMWSPPGLIPSQSMSIITGHVTFIFPGLKKFGESIKGYASLGYFAEQLLPRLKELEGLDTAQQELEKQRFIQERGIEISPSSVRLQHVAIWDQFHARPIVVPTSGNFGLGVMTIIQELREYEIEGGKTLFGNSHGRVIPWIPKVTDVNRKKLADILVMAEKLGFTCGEWETRVERSLYSLVKVLESGGFYFPTNPLSRRELKNVLAAIAEFKNSEFFTAGAGALENMGVRKIGSQLEVQSTIVGGIYGLMIPRLILREHIAANASYLNYEEVIIQPSAGGTAAADIECDRLLAELAADNIPLATATLLAAHFPALHKSISAQERQPAHRLRLARHAENNNLVTGLGEEFTIDNALVSTRPISGLGTVMPSDLPIEIMRRSLNTGGSLHDASDIVPISFTMTQVARALIFADRVNFKKEDALMPEDAGAVSLGLILQQAFNEGRFSAKDAAFLLLLGGVTGESFAYFVAADFTARAHDGEELKKFAEGIVAELGKAQTMPEITARMAELYPALSRPVHSNLLTKPDRTQITTAYMTGATGTGWAAEYREVLSRNSGWAQAELKKLSNQTTGELHA